MDRLDYEEVKKHINILNVAYHLCLEIIEEKGHQYKAICPFCGYNKNSKVPTLSLNSQNNKYCCCRCGAGGYSTGLYANVKGIDTKKAYKELLDKECFSNNKTSVEISPINLLADVELRDSVYRDFLGMLKLELQHKLFLTNIGLSQTTIDNNLYRTVPTSYIKRRLIANALSQKYDLAGIPGLYQEEDLKWTFSKYNGFFVPVFDTNGYIQSLSIHLDKPFNDNQNIWFSSSNKINGTAVKNCVMKSNINENSDSIILTNDLILGTLAKENLNQPIIAFQSICNSFSVLKQIEKIDTKNIIFLFKTSGASHNMDYIINRIFRNLVPLGYNLDLRLIHNYKDFFNEDFNVDYTLNDIA